MKCRHNSREFGGKSSLWNPFFVYILAFSISLLVYQLGWSNLYPAISFRLLLFLLLTFSYSFLVGWCVYKDKIIVYSEVRRDKNIPIIASFIALGFLLEFLYLRHVPLLSILAGWECDYSAFGIKSFHVFLVTFSSFYSVYVFHVFLSTRKRKYLIIYLLMLTMPLLIFSRGMFVLILSSSMFVYLFRIRKLHFKFIIVTLLLVLTLFYLFGLTGNIRVSHQTGRTENITSSDIILKIGDAKGSFRESIIPKEYFWAYLYISSPLANLQKTIANSDSVDLTFGTLLSFINFDILPDFVSKRISKFLEVKKKKITRIMTASVGTVYASSYVYLNWLGLVLMFSFTMLASFSYIILLRRDNVFFITGIAILNTLILFNMFSNMFSFTGMSFQLVYPLLFSFRGIKRSK